MASLDITPVVENSNEKKQIFPKEYINYDIIAGIGSVSSMSSNKNSFIECS